MKQHITVEQLNELSKKGKGNLGHWFYQKQDLSHGEDPKNLLLSIGQMIEFLDEYFSKEKRDFDIRIHSAGTAWKYPGQRLVDLSIITYEIEDEVELCDALWEACKEVLEK